MNSSPPPTFRLVSALAEEGLSRAVLDARIAIIGVGSLGSRMAELCLRLGIALLIAVDPDIVEAKDLVQGAFSRGAVGRLKVQAIRELAARVGSSTEVVPIAARALRVGPGLLSSVDCVVLALDTLEARVDFYRHCHAAEVPVVDTAVDGHLGRVTEVPVPSPVSRKATADSAVAKACFHCLYPAQGTRSSVLAGERGCRARAAPDRATIAAPYATAEVAGCAVGRVLRIAADGGTPRELRLRWSSDGVPSWRAYELTPSATCPTCGGGTRGRGSAVVTLPEASAAQHSLAEIEAMAVAELGPGRLARPAPWREANLEPPLRLWRDDRAERWGVPWGGRLEFEREWTSPRPGSSAGPDVARGGARAELELGGDSWSLAAASALEAWRRGGVEARTAIPGVRKGAGS